MFICENIGEGRVLVKPLSADLRNEADRRSTPYVRLEPFDGRGVDSKDACMGIYGIADGRVEEIPGCRDDSA